MNPSGFFRGGAAAIRGFFRSASDKNIRVTYRYLVLAVLFASVAIQLGGSWGIWELTSAEAASAWYKDAALTFLRYAGILIVILAAPLISLLLVNTLIPALSERVFLAALLPLDAARAAELEKQPGLSMAAAAANSFRRLIQFLVLSIGVLLASLIPVAGTIIGPLLQAWVTARILGWELLDPYLDKMGMDHAQQKDYVRRNRSTLFGFGLPFTFILAIPFVGPLFFGLAQASAATLVVDVLDPTPLSARSLPRESASEDQPVDADDDGGPGT